MRTAARQPANQILTPALYRCHRHLLPSDGTRLDVKRNGLSPSAAFAGRRVCCSEITRSARITDMHHGRISNSETCPVSFANEL